MTTSILVSGGTGPLVRPVAQRLRDAGASVTVPSSCGLGRSNGRRLPLTSQPLRVAALTAGRHYCLPEFAVGASCVS
jgi:hypothetical protein